MFIEVENIRNTKLDDDSKWPTIMLINIDAISSIYILPNYHREIADSGIVPDNFTIITFDKMIKIAALDKNKERKASYIVSPESYKKIKNKIRRELEREKNKQNRFELMNL